MNDKWTILIFCLLMLSHLLQAQTPASTNVPGAKYPAVWPDNRVEFRVKAPEATKMQVDFGQKYDMQRDTNGVWNVTTGLLGSGIHYYSLIVDGLSVADPASESFYGCGRMMSCIEIPYLTGGTSYEIQDVPHGDVRVKRYFSKVTDSWRKVYIYTPAGYDQKTNEKYPVLYIMHGGGEDARGWVQQGRADIILDNLIAVNKAKPMLVVMVNGNMPSDSFNDSSFLQAFESELTQVIIPFVESNYRTEKGAESRALAGLSMGGMQTLYTGLYHTDLFSYLGVFSSGWLPFHKNIADAQYDFIRKNKETIDKQLNLLWISIGGKEDIAYQNCQNMLKEFDGLELKYIYSEYPGGHSWPVWRNNLYNFAQLLFND